MKGREYKHKTEIHKKSGKGLLVITKQQQKRSAVFLRISTGFLLSLQHKQKEDQLAASRSKKEDIEVMSTTALILENRPM